jgi:hypothetical protein
VRIRLGAMPSRMLTQVTPQNGSSARLLLQTMVDRT